MTGRNDAKRENEATDIGKRMRTRDHNARNVAMGRTHAQTASRTDVKTAKKAVVKADTAADNRPRTFA